MHLTVRAHVLLLLIAVLAVAAVWSDETLVRRLWEPALALFLVGLAYEGVRLPRARPAARIEYSPRAWLGRAQPVCVVLRHAARRPVELRYVPQLPANCAPAAEVRRLNMPPNAEARDAFRIQPVRLGSETWPFIIPFMEMLRTRGPRAPGCLSPGHL